MFMHNFQFTQSDCVGGFAQYLTPEEGELSRAFAKWVFM